jgi:uncharacterized membrane protein (UPF0127 family)
MGKTSCKKGQYYCNTDQKCKPIPDGYSVRPDGILVKEDKDGDHEPEMIRSQLKTASRASKRIEKHSRKKENFKAWVQSKITKASDYLDTAADYLDGKDDVKEGSLRKWFKGSKSKDGKGGWVNVVTGGTCASDEPGEGTPKCVSSSKRASMSKKERLSASRRKKKADPGQQSKTGAAKPTYVSTDKKKKKMKEEFISLPLQLEVPQNDGEFRLGLMFRESLEQDRGMLFVFETTDRHSFHMKNTFIPLDIAFINEEGIIESIKELNPMSSAPVYPDGKIRYAVEVNRGWFAENNVVVGDILLEDIEEAEIITEVKDKKGKGSGTKDACYHKVKSRYSVWPSAYASGALVKCRKAGAANWGNSSKKEEVEYETKVYKTPHHRWRDEIVEHHKKDKDGNTIPHEDEITEMKSNPDYKGVGALKDKSKVQKPDSISIIKPYGSGPMDDKTKEEVKKFARKDVPYQDSKGGHTLSVSPQGNVMNMTKYLRREHYNWRETLDEKCWKGYEKKGMKTMFGKRYPNCVKKTKKEELEVETSSLNEKLKNTNYGPAVVNQKLVKTVDKKVKRMSTGGDGTAYIGEATMTKKQIKKRDEIADAISTKDMKDRYGDKNVKYAIATKLAMKENTAIESELVIQDWNVDEIKYTEIEAVDIIKPEPLKPSNWREDLDEDWQKVNRKDKTDGLSQKAVKAYRRENPGSKLKTAVTKDPKKLKKGSKSAKRRLSFCRRMKGMKKKLTSAKTSRDPDSRINKALRRWNC